MFYFQILAFLLAVVSVLDLGKGIQDYAEGPNVPLILIISPAIFVVTFVSIDFTPCVLP